MPKDKSPKVKVSICNTLISKINSNFKSLPRSVDGNGIIVVKLKRKVEYREHVLFERIRPGIMDVKLLKT